MKYVSPSPFGTETNLPLFLNLLLIMVGAAPEPIHLMVSDEGLAPPASHGTGGSWGRLVHSPLISSHSPHRQRSMVWRNRFVFS